MDICHIKRQPHFDTLRLMFAVAVIFSHSFELLRQPEPLQRIGYLSSLGSLGVIGFFLISGYLITCSWLEDPSISRFLHRRVLRLYPGFIVASLLSVLIVGPLGAESARYFQEIEWWKVLHGMLALRVPQTPRVFVGSVGELANGAMWTISFEFRCYLLLVLLAALGVVRRRAMLLAVTVLISLVACITVPESGPTGPNSDHIAFSPEIRLSNSMVWFSAVFLTGSCAYVFRDAIRYKLMGGLIALAALAVAMRYPLLFRPVALLAGAYVVLGMATSSAWLRAAWTSRTDLSYGIYLYGWPVQKLLAWYIPGITPIPMFVATVAICVALASISWRCIEAPALRFKPRRAITLSTPKVVAEY